MKIFLGFVRNEYFFQYFATIAGAFSVISSGINLGWTSPFLPKLQANSSTIPTTTDQGSWCAIAPLLGAPPGAVLAAIVVDKIGRKMTTLLMAPLVSACFVGIAFSSSIWEITILRFVIGSAEGALYTVLPMYVGEISDPKIRGFLTATIAIAAITGTLFINVLGSFTDIFVSSLVCALIPIIHAAAFVLVPESPYYHIKQGNYDAAKRSLQALRGRNDVDDEMEALSKAVVRQERCKTGFLDLFTVSSNRKACFIFVIVCWTNKFSGKNPCMFYTETIFKEAGSTIDATLSVIVYCGVELLAVTVTTFFVVDRFGKRLFLIVSTAGCAVSVLALSVYFFLKDYAQAFDTDFLFWVPITALVSYNVMFSMGLSFGMVTVLSELFPTSVKAKALCIADTFSVLTGAIVSKFFQISVDETGTMAVPFFCFGLCSIAGLVFIVRYMPETKGKTLEEIQQLLIGQEQYSSDLRTRQRAIVNDSFI
ncbi:facilitated trehalose transporter Tret1-like [Cylas formicarius]|uniref:facilitated trehalose transporter Tret1-like n=1 Tax=Cylas formicarius TaxID=197179 RepID=UPI002958AFD5|nr:facilitated trehalose transporter Tret1-like [Cylas formicarius]